jgi:phosphoenolpyruvate carboxykinase (ATP)
MLTCDAFGVLPPIARLTPAQAMYHFLSGFTSKVAGTERGVTEAEPTFSTCFGAPFMPRRPEVYGKLLQDKIHEHGASCWLVNTGWTGGAYGTGKRMPIKATRALLAAALDGSLNGGEFRRDPNFGFDVPVAVPGVADGLLDPRRTWADAAAYDAQARKLVGMFATTSRNMCPSSMMRSKPRRSAERIFRVVAAGAGPAGPDPGTGAAGLAAPRMGHSPRPGQLS